jgi:hypothetical protein
MLVVAGLLLAVLFVGLALVLNSGIYSDNLASRETANEPKAVQEHGSALDEHLRESADRTNARVESTDPSTLQEALQVAVANYTDQRVSDGVQRGQSIDIELESAQNGTRLRQTNASRNFTDRDGTVDWNLTDDVPDGGQFAMNVQEESLYEATLDTTMAAMADSAFGVEFHLQNYTGSGDGVWRVYVFRGAATESVYAVVETPEQTFEDSDLDDRTNPDHIVNGWLNQSCSLKSRTITIRLSEETFGGSPCAEFSFYGDIDVHNVRYVNSRTDGTDRARGTYSIMIREADYNEDGFYTVANASDVNQPFFQSAIYAFDYSYTHRTESTTYEAPNRTVLPEDGDPGGILWEHPRIERFDATYLTPGDAANNSYRIDWRVTDPNAELHEVEVELIDRTVERMNESLEEKLEKDFDSCDPVFDLLCDLTNYTDETQISQPVNTEQVVANETITVGGPEANGSATLVHDSALSGEDDTIDGSEPTNDSEYRIQLTVTDASGRATTAGKHCEIDPTFCEVA